jgi:hypothetical protein
MENCDDGAKIIQAQLEDESDFWKDYLGGRATKAEWETRHENPESWYKPFSMNKEKPSLRKPPPDWDKHFSDRMLSRLGELFKAL